LIGNVQIDGERCKGCALCIDFCPRGSLLLSAQLNLKGYFVVVFRDVEGGIEGRVDGDATTDGSAGCNGCGNCALMCPEVAIEVTRS
jgi:2-oxoglutarate ferredoxin oxidoreductase subunit delta